MIISGGHLIAIDKVRTDETLSGNGSFRPLGVKTVSSVSALSSLSSDLSGKILNGNAISDVVNEIDKKITSASPSLKNDIEVTNSVGMVFEGTTLSAGTNFEDIFTSAFKKYVSANALIKFDTASTTHTFDISAKPQNVTYKPIFEMDGGSFEISAFEFNDGVSAYECEVDPAEKYVTFDGAEEISFNNGSKTISLTAYTTQGKSVLADPKTQTITYKKPLYYGTQDLNSELVVSALTRNLDYKTTLTYSCEMGKDMYLITDKKLTKAVQSDQNVTNKWTSNSGTITIKEGITDVKYNLYKTTATDTNTFIFTLS